MALAEEDRVEAEKLIKIYRQRLRYRNEQIARMGDSADPSIPIDRDHLEHEISMLEAVLRPDTSPAVAELIKRRVEDVVFLFQQSVEQNTRLTRVEERVDRVAQEQHSASQWRLDKGGVIDELWSRATREDRDAPRGRRRNFWILITILLMAVLTFLIQVYR